MGVMTEQSPLPGIMGIPVPLPGNGIMGMPVPISGNVETYLVMKLHVVC